MGVTLAILCGMPMTSQAQSDAPTLQEQYQAASAAFMGGIFSENLPDSAIAYPEHIFKGIEGQWLPLWAFGGVDGTPGGDAAAYCEKQHDTIKIESRLLFSVVERDGSRSPRRVLYQSLGGSLFQTWVEFEDIAPAFNLVLDGNDDELKYVYRTLNEFIGEVSIFRPSPDILTIVRGTMTEIWGRCPS